MDPESDLAPYRPKPTQLGSKELDLILTPCWQGRIFLKIQPTTICWIEFTADKTQTKTQ